MRATALLFAFFVAFAYCADLDGDGYDSDPSFGEFQDCCDTVEDGCFDPFLVNPGAYEIPNNGQADRCIFGRSLKNNISGCDTTSILETAIPLATDVSIQQVALPADNTELGVLAMDICEFKDDDDDPSWGFRRQDNLIYTLADGTRNLFEQNVVGPDTNSALVLKNLAFRIPDAHFGDYSLFLTSGNLASGGVDFEQDASSVPPPVDWAAGTSIDPEEANCPNRNSLAIDSIMATFNIQQPTNMNAWALHVATLDSEHQTGSFGVPSCLDNESFFVVLYSGPGALGVSPDTNIAIDRHGTSFRSSNHQADFYNICNEYTPLKTCPLTGQTIKDGSYDGAYASDWQAIGSSALPGAIYTVQLSLWDTLDGEADSAALFDDFVLIAEARTDGTPYGYQYTADIELEHVLPDVLGFYPSTATTVTFTFDVKNNGPERAGDITINFTPPLGTSFAEFDAAWTTTEFPSAAPYEDNGFHKAVHPGILEVGELVSGSVTYNILADSPSDLQFKLSATCSSIERIWNNNYQVQSIFIDNKLESLF